MTSSLRGGRSEKRWFVWVGREGFGFRLRWIEVQVYWYGWRGHR